MKDVLIKAGHEFLDTQQPFVLIGLKPDGKTTLISMTDTLTFALMIGQICAATPQLMEAVANGLCFAQERINSGHIPNATGIISGEPVDLKGEAIEFKPITIN